MSSLKTVQEEIEKALAATLRTRFNNDDKLERDKFYEEDVKKLSKNDSQGELYLRLFIRSRQGDSEKAYEMMIASLRWRKEFGIRDMGETWLRNTNVQEVVREGILFYHNLDKKKNSILMFQGNKYKYKNQDDKVKILEQLFAYILEKQHQQRFGKQLLVICDHGNATLEHVDLKFFKFVVNLFNVYYPQILDTFLVVDVSWRVSSAWRNIQKWLSPDTSPKFKFIEKSQLTDYVDKSKLLDSLGGTDKYKYQYPPEETPSPLELPIDESGNETDTHSQFQDAIENIDEISESVITTEELPGETESMGSSLGTHVRNRFKGRGGYQSSSIEELSLVGSEILENELLVSPSEEITFQETADASELHETLTLSNNGASRLLFKIKTNSAAKFRVKPSVGALEPGSSRDVVVMLLLRGEANEDKHDWNKDKFLILFAEHAEEITSEMNISELWSSTLKSATKEYRLNCRVLDVNGLEKRPKTIDDAIEMNLKLQRQMSQLQTKMENFSDPLTHIREQLNQQRLILIVVSIFMVILLLLLIIQKLA